MFEEEYSQPQEPHTEITLSNSALLLIFFVLLAVCGACFGFGYSEGRKRAYIAPPPPAQAQSAPETAAPPAAHVSTKSAAVVRPSSTPAPPPAAVTATKAPATSAPATHPPVVKPAPAITPSADISAAAPVAIPPEHGYVVQMAGVAQQADADALAAALRRKGYPATSRSGADHVFHVLLGPFATQKDASAQRDKLVDDGYMAVIRQQ